MEIWEKVVSLSVGVIYSAMNSSALSNIKIVYPSTYYEQVKISNYLKQELLIIDNTLDKIRKAITKHQELRKALILVAVTGKIKVSDE